jgi:hypothetical protein
MQAKSPPIKDWTFDPTGFLALPPVTPTLLLFALPGAATP